MLNNNTTNGTFPPIISLSETRVILNSIFISIVMLATIIGNSLVIFCVFYYPRLRSQTNYLIVSLATADWLIGAFVLPLRLAQTVDAQWPFGFRTCQFWIWVDMLCSAASILNLMGISIERLVAVVDPLKYEKRMNKRRVCFMIGLIWIFALISASLSLARWEGPVIIIGPECSISSKEYITFVSTAAFFVPLTVVLVNYGIIFRVAVHHARRLHKETRSLATNYCAESTAPDANQNLDIPENKKRKSFLRRSFFSAQKDSKSNQRSVTISLVKQLKATKTLAVVVGVFFLCWFPFFVIFITFQYCSHTCFEPPKISIAARDAIVTIFVNVLPVANSAANPIIYTCFNAEFRKAFKKILAKRLNRKQSLENGNTSFTAVPSSTTHKEFEHSSA